MRQFIYTLTILMSACAHEPVHEQELTAAPGSIGYGMIEDADADGVFELVHNGQVSVRHVPSGMRCDFLRDGEGGSIALLPGLPRGDGASCTWGDGRELAVLRVWRDEATVDEALATAVSEINDQFPSARSWEERVHQPAGSPSSQSAAFLVRREGARLFTSVNVARVGEWTLQLRYTAPVSSARAVEVADTVATSLFQGALADMAATP